MVAYSSTEMMKDFRFDSEIEIGGRKGGGGHLAHWLLCALGQIWIFFTSTFFKLRYKKLLKAQTRVL